MYEVITLLSPIDGLTEITLREPTVDEIAKVNDDAAKFGNVRAMKNLIATMAKIDVTTVGRMGARDFNACNKYLSGFFE
ncbi:phage tail assembly protein [Paraburkholderia sp. UCT2]|uniref:phage tail assembly protein n=1 Tax=Paraburkholderia sp. UCT2 TaxID=2615208 RepID=UPI001654C580|nr:phage tail assembly protein [Paraburkholderia sp. UCT2]MBC8729444.1 phage tail assembly protein [Paraburkholderia sp. UCT2]